MKEAKEVGVARHPAWSSEYIWETGEAFYLSKRERVMAEAWLRGFNYGECVRVYREETGKEIGRETVKRWLRSRHIEAWISQQMRERGIASGWTREHWMAVMTDHLEGRKRLRDGDLYGMKLIASVNGFEQRDAVNLINQINFTQIDGRA